MDVYEKLKSLNIQLPQVPPKGGVYARAKKFNGNLIYVSGCGPNINQPIVGKLGKEFTVEQGQEYAKNCILNILSVLEFELGDLNRIKNIVKILTLVAGTDEFYDQALVANGGSQLLVDLWGEEIGAPSRSAIGVNALPGNMPVEIEGVFEFE